MARTETYKCLWENERELSARLTSERNALRQFVIDYLYSEHGEIKATDESAPYSPRELFDMARNLLARREETAPALVCPKCNSAEPGVKYFVEPISPGVHGPCAHPFHKGLKATAHERIGR